MRNKYAANHVLLRDGVFYYVRRVPLELADHYSVKRLCFSLRTKSYKSAIHASKLVKSDDVSHGSYLLLKANEFFQIVSQPKRTANEIR